MKKIIAILAAALLTLSFTACGGRKKVDLSNAKNISELSGATIAAQSGTFHYDALEQISDITVKDYPDFPALLIALKQGVIDGYVAEEPTAYAECLKDSSLAYLPFVNNQTGFTATEAETGIAVAFTTGNPLVERVNEVIATISLQTKIELMEQMVALSLDKDTDSGEDIVLVSNNTNTSNGTLKIAMECGYDPFNWTQTTPANDAVVIANGPTGSTLYANGYDVQVAKYIAAELGMALEVYQYEWDALIPAVQSNAVDGIIAGMSPTEEREQMVDFTDCYYVSNLVIIYKKAN